MVLRRLLPVLIAVAVSANAQDVATLTRLAEVWPGATDPGCCPADFGPMVPWDGRVAWLYGTELWVSDGTQAGTGVVRDVSPAGRADKVHSLVAAGGTLFFAGEAGGGIDLWRSDGTTQGTNPVYDLAGQLLSGPIAAGSRVIFSESIYGLGPVWGSDGTEAGTEELISGSYALWGLIAAVSVGDEAVLVAGTKLQMDSRALFRSNGTAAGTSRILGFGRDLQVSLARFGAGVIVAVVKRYGGVTLWRSDLTAAGTQAFFEDGQTGTYARFEAEAAGLMYFVLRDELWVTDGTTTGTRAILAGQTSRISQVVAAGDHAFFVAWDGVHGSELWRSDGSPAGTRMVADILPGEESSLPGSLVARDGRVYFLATTAEVGRELWTSDGTAVGTHLVSDLCPGACSGLGVTPIGALAGDLVFPGRAGAEGCRLWMSDGTAAGTRAVADVALPSTPGTRSPGGGVPPFVAVNGGVVFPGLSRDDPPPRLAWSDGTALGTRPLPGLPPGWSQADFPDHRPILGGSLLLASAEPEVWRVDGSAQGTARVDPGAMRYPSSPDARGRIFFWRESGKELWVTDGTPSGTRLVRAFPSTSLAVATVGELAVFTGYDLDHGHELWVSDGTGAGTHLLVDLCPGTCSTFAGWSSYPRRAERVGRKAYFLMGEPSDFYGLLATDGTVAGTEVLRPLLRVVLTLPVPLGDFGLFTAAFGSSILWRTDGTAAGTREVARLPMHTLRFLSVVGETPPEYLVFTANDGVHGYEPWRTDGTPGGTALLRDIAPGRLWSSPHDFLWAHGRTWFGAGDPEHGYELWSSDGTEAGTSLALDSLAGPGSGLPWGMTSAGDRLFFASLGWLWSLRTSSVPRIDVLPATACDAPGCPASAQVSVVLSEPGTTAVTVTYETEPVTAAPGEDYLPVGGTIVVPAGSSGPVTVTVPIVLDRRTEGEERFVVRLVHAEGGIVGRGWGTVLIRDDRIFGSVRQRLHR